METTLSCESIRKFTANISSIKILNKIWVVKIQIANIVPNWLLQRQAEFLFSIFNQKLIITPLLSRGRGTCLKLSETCSVAAEARRNLCPGREECRSLLYAERMRLQQSPGNSGPPWPCRELQSSPGYWRNKISLHWPKCRIELETIPREERDVRNWLERRLSNSGHE